MDERQGIMEASKVDFLFRPLLSGSLHKPVVVFTDGFQFHKDSVSEDTLKRQALSRTRRYRVWTLSWRDVQNVFRSQGDYCPNVLSSTEMPSGLRIYQPYVQNQQAEALGPGRISAFDLLVHYLGDPDAERLFAAHARAYGLSLLQPGEMAQADRFGIWHSATSPPLQKCLWLTRSPPLLSVMQFSANGRPPGGPRFTYLSRSIS